MPTFSSAVQLFSPSEILLGSMYLYINSNYTQYMTWVDGSSNITTIFNIDYGLPNISRWDLSLMVYWKWGYLQLSLISTGGMQIPIAYTVPSSTDIQSLRVIPTDFPTSSWLSIAANCGHHSQYVPYPPTPYVPLTAPNSVQSCTLFPVGVQWGHMFFPGSLVNFVVSPSMSGLCSPNITLCLGDSSTGPSNCYLTVSIASDAQGRQTIDGINARNTWNNDRTFLDWLQPTTLWVAMDAYGYLFVGVGETSPTSINLNALVVSEAPVFNASAGNLLVTITDTDWQITSNTWNPLAAICYSYGFQMINWNTQVGTGPAIAFSYVISPLTSSTPLLCSPDNLGLAAVFGGDYETFIWIMFPSDTSVSITYQDRLNYHLPQTQQISGLQPFSNQSFVSISTSDGSATVTVGVYDGQWNSNAATNVSFYEFVFDFYATDGACDVVWNIAGYSQSAVQVQTCPPTPTILPASTTSVSTTGQRSNGTDQPSSWRIVEIIVGIVVVIAGITVCTLLIRQCVARKQLRVNGNVNGEHRPLIATD